MTIPDAAASSSVTAPLVIVSVAVAHLEQRIVAICGMLDVEDVVDELRLREPSVDVELEELEEESEDGEDGPAIVEGWTGMSVWMVCVVLWWEWRLRFKVCNCLDFS